MKEYTIITETLFKMRKHKLPSERSQDGPNDSHSLLGH